MHRYFLSIFLFFQEYIYKCMRIAYLELFKNIKFRALVFTDFVSTPVTLYPI